uniref:ZM domain-containing protein n=1 Tax=Steinernema glaseri TaxID=37863 RepID=A0A1I7ZIQ7_9BILA
MSVDKMEVAREWAAAQFDYGRHRERDVFSNLTKQDQITRESKLGQPPPLRIIKKPEPIQIPSPVVERPHSTPSSSASSVVSSQPAPPVQSHSQPTVKQETPEVREVHSPAPAVTALHQQQQQQQLQMQQQQQQIHQQQPPPSQPRPIQPAPQVAPPTSSSQPPPQKVYHIPAQPQPAHEGQQGSTQPTTRYVTAKSNISGISAVPGRRISVQQQPHVVIGQAGSGSASSSPGQYTVVVSSSDPTNAPSGTRIQAYMPSSSSASQGSQQSGQQNPSGGTTVYRTIAPGYGSKRIPPAGARAASGAQTIYATNAQGTRQLITTHNLVVPGQSGQGQGSSGQTTYVRNVPQIFRADDLCPERATITDAKTGERAARHRAPDEGGEDECEGKTDLSRPGRKDRRRVQSRRRSHPNFDASRWRAEAAEEGDRSWPKKSSGHGPASFRLRRNPAGSREDRTPRRTGTVPTRRRRHEQLQPTRRDFWRDAPRAAGPVPWRKPDPAYRHPPAEATHADSAAEPGVSSAAGRRAPSHLSPADAQLSVGALAAEPSVLQPFSTSLLVISATSS